MRLDQVRRNYERKIQELKDKMMIEQKQSDDNLKRTIEQMQRVHQMSFVQLEAQNRDRINRLSAEHADEVRSINQRQKEKLDELVVQTKKTWPLNCAISE